MLVSAVPGRLLGRATRWALSCRMRSFCMDNARHPTYIYYFFLIIRVSLLGVLINAITVINWQFTVPSALTLTHRSTIYARNLFVGHRLTNNKLCLCKNPDQHTQYMFLLLLWGSYACISWSVPYRISCREKLGCLIRIFCNVWFVRSYWVRCLILRAVAVSCSAARPEARPRVL